MWAHAWLVWQKPCVCMSVQHPQEQKGLEINIQNKGCLCTSFVFVEGGVAGN